MNDELTMSTFQPIAAYDFRSSFIVHRSSFAPPPSSFILHPSSFRSSFIVHRSSFARPSSFILHPSSFE
jgi:hypothetical protein